MHMLWLTVKDYWHLTLANYLSVNVKSIAHKTKINEIITNSVALLHFVKSGGF